MHLMQCVLVARLAAPSLLALLALAVGCGGDDDGLTYQKDVSTIFADCTLCHQQGAPFGPGMDQGPDMVDLYSEPNGLLVSPAQWKANHPEYSIPTREVTPGQPDDSFLINKIADQLPDMEGGVAMPYQIAPITPDELASIEQWVRDGANSDDFYQKNVAPIFVGTSPLYPGKCNACHYENSPNPPDLTHPFGPDGVIGIPSIFRSDLLRVAPGDPDASLLVQRVRESAGDNLPSSEFGAPMPKPTPALDEAQVQVVRQWILDGAHP